MFKKKKKKMKSQEDEKKNLERRCRLSNGTANWRWEGKEFEAKPQGIQPNEITRLRQEKSHREGLPKVFQSLLISNKISPVVCSSHSQII